VPTAEEVSAAAHDALAPFSPLVREWFTASFAAPTAAQVGAWASIATGAHTLVVAPTGSGKTLAAFLSAIDTLVTPGVDASDDVFRRRSRSASDAPVTVSAAPRHDPAGVGGSRGDDAGSTSRAAGRCRVLYISPLKALAVDVERNLRSPLAGISAVAAAHGARVRTVDVAVRSGDTPATERAAFARRGADILITTPESLFLLLTSKAREALSGVQTVIVDEIHAVAGTKRGAHLAVSLDRLDALIGEPAQRIGLSATVRPTDEVARFLAGGRPVTIVAPPTEKQVDIDVVVPVADMSEIGAPTGDLAGPAAAGPPRSSIWPHVEERIVDLIEGHHSTIVFANSRRLAERLTARLNEIHAARIGAEPVDEWSDAPPPAQIMAQSGAGRGAPAVLARAHHGSVSRQGRAEIENALKRGQLPAVVATSSLELGIDMGAVDLVIQVESPPSVASGLQRIGRAGHQVGAPSKGVLFPKFRGDLVSAAVATERMQHGQIERLRVVANPLDVAAQQIVSICAMDTVTADEVFALLRRSAPFAGLTRGALESVLDMLSGRYPSERFAELRPRLTWDRVTDRLIARPGAQRLAVTSGGTIPDRGLYGVFLAGTAGGDPPAGPAADGADDSDGAVGGASGSASPLMPAASSASRDRRGGRRVGELDEEMVYESRVGDVFVLGSSSWRITEIGKDRVEVIPAPGMPGRLPFWKADAAGRPAELGGAHGAFARELGAAEPAAARERLAAIGLDDCAADNLLAYLSEQREATGVLPDDRTLVAERFRDELGDWRVVIHSPYGAAVHAPWALVIAARLRERYGIDVQAQHSDDGIVLRLPDIEYDGGLPDLADAIVLDADSVHRAVTAQLGGSAVFAARFRECAARSLLLPRQQIGRRQPLWQQRQRAAQLLEVAAGYPEFPVVAEAARECLADVFDVAALTDLMRRIAARDISVVEVTTPAPSPFARSLLFGYVAHFIYDGDTPLAERRAAALTVDPALLAELLGAAEAPSLRDLLDADAIAAAVASLQRLAPDRRARGDDDIADLVRILGPLTTDEIAARAESTADVAAALRRLAAALRRLAAARRLMEVRIAGRSHWADPADAGLLRDALGVALPAGIAEIFLAPVADPLGRLLGRFARTHGPFTASAAASRLGLGVAVVRDGLVRLVDEGRLARGEFLPWGSGAVTPPAAPDDRGEFVDVEVLRLLRRRSLAALRAEIEPVPPSALGRFLPAWSGIGIPSPGAGRPLDRLFRAVEQLSGALVPASALETLVLPARVPGYSPALLDEAMTSGEVTWSAHGRIGGADAWIALHLTETAALTLRPPDTPSGPITEAIVDVLRRGGAFFFPALDGAVRAELLSAAGGPPASGTRAPSGQEVLDALWGLVFAGTVTGDTLAPLRAVLSDGRTVHRTRPRSPRARLRSPSRLAMLASARPGADAVSAATRGALVPASAAGRWSLLPQADSDPTVRIHAAAEILLDRYGVVTRGSAVAEEVPGGFAGVYRVLSAMEESGRIRRGYFVEGLGAAQFAEAGAVDRLRALSPGDAVPGDHDRAYGGGTAWSGDGGPAPGGHEDALVLAAADPANPYGAALPWPEPLAVAPHGDFAGAEPPARSSLVTSRLESDHIAPRAGLGGIGPQATEPSGHRPSRRAGAMVCLVAGVPVLYLERGGRTMLTFTEAPGALRSASFAVADLIRSSRLDALTVATIDGLSVHGLGAPAVRALRDAGFTVTPRGLRLRAGQAAAAPAPAMQSPTKRPTGGGYAGR
jgi:ATP-dependent Lhr-like helicase